MSFPRIWVTLLLAVVGGLWHAPAFAQATRTWVSGVGDDANPCSRTAPCKTFAGTISKTAAGGIIDCLDPGGFGAVTIVKSITIDCESQAGGPLVSGQSGVTINGAGVVVTLRNMSIEGIGSGVNGVNFINGASLSIENCNITQFQASAAMGIRFAPEGVAAELSVVDSVISTNGIGSVGGGIVIQPTGTGSAKAFINNVTLHNNRAGLRADGTGSTGGISVAIVDSVVSGNTAAGITSFTPGGGAPTSVMVSRTLVSGNGTGLNANGAGATLLVGSSVVSGNTTGASIQGGAAMQSFGNNQIEGNNSAGDAIPLIALK